MVSRTNMPASTVPCPPTPANDIHATTTSRAMPSSQVARRRPSSRNRSSISSAKAPPASTSSGSSGSSSAVEKAVAAVVCSIGGGSSELARGQLAGKLRDGGLHQVGQRLRPDADQQHAGGEGAEHDPFAHVQVGH